MRKIIIRLDDACPTMNKTKWDVVEKKLDAFNIKPIVAVIPNNQDEKLKIETFDTTFWDKVRSWQEKGWHIALHGYNHKYIQSPKKALVPINTYSEFSGLPYKEQLHKIQQGLEIFKRESIKTKIWVAPAHTFDKNTLRALKETGNISIISDGIAFYPYFLHGYVWLPQQTWDFSPPQNGVWTVCIHPNTESDKKLEEMQMFLSSHADQCIPDIQDIVRKFRNRKKSILDHIYTIRFFRQRKKNNKK